MLFWQTDEFFLIFLVVLINIFLYKIFMHICIDYIYESNNVFLTKT